MSHALALVAFFSKLPRFHISAIRILIKKQHWKTMTDTRKCFSLTSHSFVALIKQLSRELKSINLTMLLWIVQIVSPTTVHTPQQNERTSVSLFMFKGLQRLSFLSVHLTPHTQTHTHAKPQNHRRAICCTVSQLFHLVQPLKQQ